MKERNQIIFEDFYPAKAQAKLLEKMKDKIRSRIAELQNEMNYDREGMTPQKKLDWTIKNDGEVNARLQQLCLDLHIPEEYLSNLGWFFYTGSDFYLSLSDTAPYDFAFRADFSNSPYSVHEQYRWLPESELNHPQLFEHDFDFLIRGNFETFTIDGWRRLGNMLIKYKKQFEAGKYYGIVRGRPYGATTEQANKQALEMYQIHKNIKETYKGKQRKHRKGKSRWHSIYDEVAFSYESIHRLTSGTISGSHVKYLVGKGKRIYEATKDKDNSA